MMKKKISYEKHAAQARFVMKQNAPHDLSIKNAPQAGFFDHVFMSTLSCKCSMYFFFHKPQLRIFFFELINGLIN